MATIAEAFDLAVDHHQQGQFSEAEELYRRIVAVDPRHHGAWNGLGVVAVQTRQLPQAIEHLHRAIALDARVPEYFNNLGLAMCLQGRPAEGEVCFRQALELRPNYAEAAGNLRSALHIPAYPKHLPTMNLQADLDLLLLNLPPMNAGEMIPNGLAYVHNALLRSAVRFQTIDVNIVLYHTFQQRRILGKRPIVTDANVRLDDDLWSGGKHLQWEREEVLTYFDPEIRDLLDQIVAQRPKAVGLSVHANNRAYCKRFVRMLRKAAPDVLVIVGGYDCLHYGVAQALFPDFDYMAIFEADLTIGPLMEAIGRGERPRDLPGIVSRFDTPQRAWQDAPIPEDLDRLDFPRYQWGTPGLYEFSRNTIPILSSRGCAWSRCRFCGECFPFRARDPRRVADEIEEWSLRGAHGFHFYDSDVNGDPLRLEELCLEIARRRLPVHCSAQIRVHKKNTAEHFRILRQGGFLVLRFGVDGWNDHTLKLQRKGYNMEMVYQNLRDCHAAGITVTGNMVIGVPGETEEDVEECIRNIIHCKPWMSCMEYINPLMLRCGTEYFQNPERYQIRFRIDKHDTRAAGGDYFPDDQWYSEGPFIDQAERVRRMAHVCEELARQGMPLGAPTIGTLQGLQRPGAFVDGGGELRQRTQPESAVKPPHFKQAEQRQAK